MKIKQTLEEYYQAVLTEARTKEVEWLFPDAEVCRDAYEDECDVAEFIEECLQEARSCC